MASLSSSATAPLRRASPTPLPPSAKRMAAHLASSPACPRRSIQPPAAAAAAEEVTRLCRDLPPRPTVDEVEAAAAVLSAVDAEEEASLAEIAREVEVAAAAAAAAEEGVPGGISSVLVRARRNAVQLRMLQRRKEAAHVVELEKGYKMFDELLQWTPRVVGGDGVVVGVDGKQQQCSELAAAKLTEDLILEILCRLPAKSVRRFNCVSNTWLNLISNPAHRKKLPQTMCGVFYTLATEVEYPEFFTSFASLTGRDQPLIDSSLSFLPRDSYGSIYIDDYCNGLLLVRCWKFSAVENDLDFIVCNPSTSNWVTLPQSGSLERIHNASLAFDPAVSSQFRVFAFTDLGGHGYTSVVRIYSSETGCWSHKELNWDFTTHITSFEVSKVFFNGILYFVASEFVLVTMNLDGSDLRTSILPSIIDPDNICIGHSQGCIYLMSADECHTHELSVWVLEDYANYRWTLKHRFTTSELFGVGVFNFPQLYKVIAIHPECNLIFLALESVDEVEVMSYNMNCMKLDTICKLEGCIDTWHGPYVPLFSDSLAGGN